MSLFAILWTLPGGVLFSTFPSRSQARIKEEGWRMVAAGRKNSRQTYDWQFQEYGQKKTAVRRAVDRAQEGGWQSTGGRWTEHGRVRRKNCTENLTRMVAKIWYSRWHGIEPRMEGTWREVRLSRITKRLITESKEVLRIWVAHFNELLNGNLPRASELG